MSRFRGTHWIFLIWFWAGLLFFLAHVIAATIQVGHLPTYGQPDPKDVVVPGLYELAIAGAIMMVVGFPFVFVMTILRPVMAPRTRDGILTMTLSVVGLLLSMLLFVRFGEWMAD